MRKLILSAALFGSMAIIAPATFAAPAASSTAIDAPQIRVQIGRNNRRVRTRTYTRIVGFGRNRYRETVRVRYLPNGRTVTTVIRRQRIGWGRG